MLSTVIKAGVAFLLLALPNLCSGQCPTDAGCFPALGNLAFGRNVVVSSSCATEFCISGTNTLTTCNGSEYLSTNINDGNKDTYWVSEVGSNLSLPVIIRLDFEAPVLFDSMTMLWRSSRPEAMILERSSDNGNTWTPFRYYSQNCTGDFNLDDSVVTPIANFSGEAAICTSQESLFTPPSGGMVTFQTSSHSVDNMIEYRTVTNLRVQLLRLNTIPVLPQDCLQYFAVAEWNVTGTCMCNGHASSCAPAPGESISSNKVYASCMCAHNTAGLHCEMCETGFNNLPWREGNETSANSCEACQCNGHAEDCMYQDALMTAVCINCTDNTTGNNCAECVPEFYPDSTLLMSDQDYCKSCDCDPVGAVNNNCDSNGQCSCKSNVDSATMKCSQCKNGFWNLNSTNPLGCIACDCSAAGTQLVGNASLCNKTTGQCQCSSANVIGDRCSECQAGFFAIMGGCNKVCNCDSIGSLNSSCDIETGQCPCRPNITGSVCNRPEPGYYYNPLDDVTFDAEEANFSSSFSLLLPLPNSIPTLFTGRGFVSAPSPGNISFVLSVPKSSKYQVMLRYQAMSNVAGVTATITSLVEISRNLQCSNLSVSQLTTYTSGQVILPSTGTFNREYCFSSLCFEQGATYALTIEYNPTAINELVNLDSVVLMPDFREVSAHYMSLPLVNQTNIDLCLSQTLLPNPDPSCQLAYFQLSVEFYGQVFGCEGPSTIGANLNSSSVCDPNGGSYICNEGFTGTLCDQCQNGLYNYTEDSGCQACACDPVGSMTQVCDQHSGQCSCKSGVGGQQCSACLQGFYNLSTDGCSACGCSQYSQSLQCSESGQCTCPPQVEGLTCNQCSDGYYGISTSGCEPCGCIPLGSGSTVCNKTTGQCPCVGNAMGHQCSLCPDDFIPTEGTFQTICIPCVCSGFSQQCQADNGTFIRAARQSPFHNLCQVMPDNCSDGWQLLEDDGTPAAPFGPSNVDGLGYILLNGNNPTLNAPEKYLGDQRQSYGLRFEVVLVISDVAQLLPEGSNRVWMRGSLFSEALTGTFSVSSNNNVGPVIFSIRMNESQWRVGSPEGNISTFYEFYSVISNITMLQFSAKFTEAIVEFIQIQQVNLYFKLPRDEAVLANITGPLVTAESCSCPQGRVGFSCEQCADGYYRTSGNPADPCLPCQCNNQTQTCDQTTGVCINCTGNSAGEHCELCLPGYFGNTTIGVLCLPCQCPLPNKNFSPTCFLDSDIQQTCDRCATGYTGRQCELCDNGYFGNPLMVDGVCNTCECNNNVNPSLGPTCNMTSGQCLNCQNNTTGYFCQLCEPGYYGDIANDEACQECQCSVNGTVPEMCDTLMGTCFCIPNVTGQSCSECVAGLYGDPVKGIECRPCDCPGSGVTLSPTCILDSDGLPTCDNCTTGYAGRQCEICADGYFRNSQGLCMTCNCNGNVNPSLGPTCDMTNGQCLNCQNNTIGFNCQLCKLGFYGDISKGEPCQPCNCSQAGTTVDTCDILTGTCFCLPHTIGSDCSQCEPGFWNLTSGVGCVPCDCCSNGSVSPTCNQVTGDCDCLPGVGDLTDNKCCQCSPNHFNFSSTGCQECGCSELSASPQCNISTGVCECINGGFGAKCDQCDFGHIGRVPNCTQCHQCFFLWSDTLQGLRGNVTFLLNRIQEVLAFYDGFDVTEIENTVAAIQGTVTSISQSLNAIMPNESIADSVEMILNEINAAYGQLATSVQEIQNSTAVSEMILMDVSQFLTTLKSTGVLIVPVEDIFNNITALNQTIYLLEKSANTSFSKIETYYAMAVDRSRLVEELLYNASQAFAAIRTAENMTVSANSLASNFTSLITNLSSVDGSLKSVQQWAYSISNGTAEANVSASVLSTNITQLSAQINMINSTLIKLSNLTSALQLSTQQVLLAAEQQLEATRNLSEMANTALASALSLLSSVSMSLEEADNASDTLLSTQRTAQQLLGLPSLPTDEAVATARAINESIIPEQLIEELHADAINSSSIANATLNKANDARMLVDMLNSTVSGLTSDLQCTQSALTQAMNNSREISEAVNTTSGTLQQVENATAEVAQLASAAEQIFNSTNNSISEANELQQRMTARAEELQNTTTSINSAVQNAHQALQNIQANETMIKDNVENLHSQAVNSSQASNDALAQAKALNATAQAVELQRLQTLIANYTTKRMFVGQLRANITTLRKELQSLTTKFTEAADRYKRCYKTP